MVWKRGLQLTMGSSWVHRQECLRRAGFELWDLGGADHSPMMQYKPQVALEARQIVEFACGVVG